MKNIKSTIGIIMSLLVLCFTIVGCNAKVTAIESAKIYWEMNITHNISNISKINLTEKEGQAAIENDKNEAKVALRQTFTESQMKFTNEQLEQVCNALIGAYSKTNVVIEEVSNNGNKAEIKYISTYFDMSTIDENASNKTLDAITSSGLTDQKQIIDEFSELYINNLISEFDNVTISKDTKEKIIMFVKKGSVWVPEDTNNFGISLGKLITNQP